MDNGMVSLLPLGQSRTSRWVLVTVETGGAGLEESDIIDLEKRYWLLKAQSRTGRFDLETFVRSCLR
ncbi:hypothetical protein INR49_008004, partial [Caranx melampygus]